MAYSKRFHFIHISEKSDGTKSKELNQMTKKVLVSLTKLEKNFIRKNSAMRKQHSILRNMLIGARAVEPLKIQVSDIIEVIR